MTVSHFDPQSLLDPKAYPWPADEVRLIETHISWVYLAGERVVKIKRPVELGFVDFRDPVRRKQACEDEVRLNKRLTTDVYLGVVPVTAAGVDAPGDPIEWAVVMRRLPADRMLDRLLKEGAAPDDLAERLADRLIPFHAEAAKTAVSGPGDSFQHEGRPRGGAPTGALASLRADATKAGSSAPNGEILCCAQNDMDMGTQGGSRIEGATRKGTESLHHGRSGGCPQDPDTYLEVLTDNLAQVVEVASDILGRGQLALVDRSMRGFMEDQGDWLEDHLFEWLREGHGDLRCEHICLEPDVMQIYDCVEFEIAIRCADVASDLAFLLMDLRRLGASDVGEELLERYREAGFDLPRPVVDLYAAHRALVRSKVAALARSGKDPDTDRNHASEAASYLDIATSFACPSAPMLVLVSGLSGSGKSTVSAAIGRATNGAVLASDAVRKELAGLQPTESAASDWQQGIYSDDWTDRTYDRLLGLAKETLERGQTAVVDATFLDNEQRERFVGLCRTVGSSLDPDSGVTLAAARRSFDFAQDDGGAATRSFVPQDDRDARDDGWVCRAVVVWIELDDVVARERIERRAAGRTSVSDATFAIRERQVAQLAETPLRLPDGALPVTIDTGADGPASLDPFFVALEEAGLMGSLRREGAAANA